MILSQDSAAGNTRQPQSVAHDPLLCGLDNPPCCPGCIAEDAAKPLDDDTREHLLVAALFLPRRPQILERGDQDEITLRLLDLEKTLRRRPEWGELIRKILRRILGGATR